jgi:mRNA interferase HigB
MQVLSRSTLRDFWQRHATAKRPLRVWLRIAEQEIWTGPADVKLKFGRSVDFVADNRAIFDIGGNKYRLIAHISYRFRRVLIKFVGTHSEYDKIDPETVDGYSTDPKRR